MVFTSRNPHQLWSSSLGIRINSGFAFHGAASTLGITVQASARARSLSPMSLSLPHLSLSPSLPPLLPPPLPSLVPSLSLSRSLSLSLSLTLALTLSLPCVSPSLPSVVTNVGGIYSQW